MSLFDRYPTLRRVIVNLKGAEAPAFRGVLWQRRGRYLVLRNAEMLKARGEVTPVDGELVIPVENVSFMQVVG